MAKCYSLSIPIWWCNEVMTNIMSRFMLAFSATFINRTLRFRFVLLINNQLRYSISPLFGVIHLIVKQMYTIQFILPRRYNSVLF